MAAGCFWRSGRTGGNIGEWLIDSLVNKKLLAFGVYPEISAPEARKAAQQAREHLAAGRDPGLVKKILKGANCTENTFQAVAEEWIEKFKHMWTESHFKNVSGRLQRDIYPWIGNRPVGEITAPELLAVLRKNRSAWAYRERPSGINQCWAGIHVRYCHWTGGTQPCDGS